ncbi:MAG: FAD-dependent oxidoreductase [Thiohalocapsa sp.]|jgi:malate dehydrogenase (quinone)|uniref:FAD-dependent oxidoreductase n=1 Tax=Thiohalocapsa sp. TaxID=2497641 RepID=UPI0025CF8D24|nr:FAD-dependent oxidoreductase [Thiohalocapsa sp.]MCG6941810.1 FAD-dependent oxidoreductase [Thiohalocapsa sp.]
MTASTHSDCVIVGGGVTGTALLYELARFTDLKRLLLLERRERPAQVNSHAHNNSQTIHFGDIETNYSLEKAAAVKRTASMIVNYATKLPSRERDRIIHRMPKMVLGVGARECGYLRGRFQAFRDLYPRMQLLERHDIADLEPNVALVDGAWRKEEIVATGTPDDYCAVDFQALAESFSAQCVRIDRAADRHVSQLYGTAVSDIAKDGNDYVLQTSRGPMLARSVVVCAGGHSLLMAQQMGFGLEYSCLPVAGSFYFAPEALNGKVYTVQNPKLPFAAVHGDRDIVTDGKTRFGPTALMLPMLERYNRATIRDFFRVLNLDRDVVATLWDLMKVRDVRNYVLRNFLYEVPGLNRRLFLREIRKIVPDLRVRDIEYAHGYGGVRPQLIDRRTRELKMGEVKILDGHGIVFNMTPSPGGTSCLGNAEQDMRLVAEHLGARVDWTAFERELLTGHDDTRGVPPLAAAS